MLLKIAQGFQTVNFQNYKHLTMLNTFEVIFEMLEGPAGRGRNAGMSLMEGATNCEKLDDTRPYLLRAEIECDFANEDVLHQKMDADYFLERLKLNHRPTTIGTASASQAAQCHAPVFNKAASKPNTVSIASTMGARQTNQKLLREVDVLVIACF